ncbi:MAG: hypothetical protein ITG02_08560 [Patulibacter sp.]|nr:hypothetical protein [Patulibacter sp.]
MKNLEILRAANPPYDAQRVAELAARPIEVGEKGWPATAEGRPPREIAATRLRVLDGDLPFPALVLRQDAVRQNIVVMHAYCAEAGVALAPHGKTTMAPQLFARQLDQGAWGLTAATPAHLRVYCHVGVKRIVYANQLVEPAVIEWLSAALDADDELEVLSLVDSVAGVRRLERCRARVGARRPLRVLVELGLEGARTGARSVEQALTVARAAARADGIVVAGVEGFEGLAPSAQAVDAFLGDLADLAARIEQDGLVDPDQGAALVTAGGSIHFDRVVARFRDQPLLLRGGCYVTHDDGVYERESPLAGRGADRSPRLQNALELWSVVLSRPEPGLVITSMGKRDVGFDLSLPTPTMACTPGDARPRELAGRVLALSDQHAHVAIDPRDPVAVGDLVGATISHPCTTLDRWRVIPVIDDDYLVVDGLRTCF